MKRVMVGQIVWDRHAKVGPKTGSGCNGLSYLYHLSHLF